jgi:hypothetical protein
VDVGLTLLLPGDDPDSTIAIKLPPPSWTQDTLRIPGYVLEAA